MKLIAILLIIVLVTYAQDFQEESLASGSWTYNYGEARDVPRYFICGAEMTQYRSMRMNPEVCTRICRKPWWAIWKSCEWKTECKKAEDSIDWVRSDSLRFTFCNYIKWSDQYTSTNRGAWPKMGIKMCPANQLVHGFQTKINGRDGLSGLILLCRNPYNTSQSSQVSVLVGEGLWSAPKTSTGYATAFDLKMESYMTGLRIHFRPIPIIYNIALNYATLGQI